MVLKNMVYLLLKEKKLKSYFKADEGASKAPEVFKD